MEAQLEYIHIAYSFLLNRCLVTKFLQTGHSSKLIKSALLVGKAGLTVPPHAHHTHTIGGEKKGRKEGWLPTCEEGREGGRVFFALVSNLPLSSSCPSGRARRSKRVSPPLLVALYASEVCALRRLLKQDFF